MFMCVQFPLHPWFYLIQALTLKGLNRLAQSPLQYALIFAFTVSANQTGFTDPDFKNAHCILSYSD